MPLTKKILTAVEEGLPFFWTYEGSDPFSARTVAGGWTLRVRTVQFENGSNRSRKVFQTLDRARAESVHRALKKMGITAHQTMPWTYHLDAPWAVESPDDGEAK